MVCQSPLESTEREEKGKHGSDKGEKEGFKKGRDSRTFYGVRSGITPTIRRVRVLLRGIFAQNGGLKGMRLGSPRKDVKMKYVVFES